MRAALHLAEMAAILTAVGVLGFPLVRGIPKLSRAERAAWSWVAGLLALGASEGALLLLGIRPDPWKLWGLLAVIALAARGRLSRTREPESRLAGIEKLAWALALCALALFTLEAVSEPMWAWDFVAIWGLKGKTLFLSGGLPARFLHDSRLAFMHPSYPLLLPALFAGLSSLAGEWDSQALALLYPGFELATLLLIWGFLRRRWGPSGAAVAVVLTAGYFRFYQSFLVGLGDIPIALGCVLAGSALLDALDTDGVPQLRPLVLSALFCCGLKKEGAAFLLLLAVAVAVRGLARARRRDLIAASVFALVPLAHEAALRALRGPVADPRFRWQLLAERGAGMFADRLLETGGYLLHSVLLPALPTLLAVAMIFVCTRPGIADLLLVPAAVLIGLYAVTPALSTWSEPALLARSSFIRVSSALVPTLLLVLGARISASVEGFSLPFSRDGLTMK